MNLSEWSTDIVQPSTAATMKVKVRDSFHSARGYREVAVEYTAIPDAMYPWDPKVLRRIWAFRPDAVPLWVRWVFRTPEDEESPHDIVFGRHALGLVGKGEPQESFRVGMPTMPTQGIWFAKPTALWFIHEGSVDPEHRDLPGSYLPFDDTLVDRVKRTSAALKMSDKEYKAHLRQILLVDREENLLKRKVAMATERAEQDADFEDYARRQFDQMSVDDKNRLFASH